MIFDNDKLKGKINTLENENDTLRKIMKDELWKAFINKLGEPEEIERLRTENKRLRAKINELKGLLNEKRHKR